jgi:hypothetical protein
MRVRFAVALVTAAVTVITASTAVLLHLGAGHVAPPSALGASSPPATAAPVSTSASPQPASSTATPSAAISVVTRWHYTANGNFGPSGRYLPGSLGFNLADVSSLRQLDSLPTGVLGLVWLGYCGGADATFHARVAPFIGKARTFGFYMMDEPDPSTCLEANLKAECDWIHQHMPGVRTFALLENRGSSTSPTFANSYMPGISGLDVVGLDPYPVRSNLPAPDYAEIARYVQAAEAVGWPQSSLVPVFQAFGGGNWAGGATWRLPTPAQEEQILTVWATVLPAPLFDYAYSWGQQHGDQSLSASRDLQPIFAAHNE